MWLPPWTPHSLVAFWYRFDVPINFYNRIYILSADLPKSSFLSIPFRDVFLNENSWFAFFVQSDTVHIGLYKQWTIPTEADKAFQIPCLCCKASWEADLDPYSYDSPSSQHPEDEYTLAGARLTKFSRRGGTWSGASFKGITEERANFLGIRKTIHILSHGLDTSNGGSNHKSYCGNHLIVTSAIPTLLKVGQAAQCWNRRGDHLCNRK